MRILGIDYGEKRIGLALSDPSELIATPLTIIYPQKETDIFKKIVEITEKHDVKRIVIGLPRSLSGTLGPQAKLVQDFRDKLVEHVKLPVVEWDERLSTVAVSRLRIEVGRSKKRKVETDATAAAFVLQNYLDSLRNRPATE